jgi:PBSX family phage terminase large subunit
VNLSTLNFGPRLLDYAFGDLRYDRRITLLDGSVRSGKTFTQIPKMVSAASYPVKGAHVIIGQTKDTVYTNILQPLFEIIGDSSEYRYYAHGGILKFAGVEWKIVGAKDEGSEKYIRGATVGVALVDEVVLIPEAFWNMLLTRMSSKGARLYGTTNPDHPLHWLKTKFLDNQELYKTKQLRHIHCTMDDNPNLTKQFIQSQKLLFKGMFYKRFILGEWVMAAGSIWGDYWKDEYIYDEAPATLKNAGGHVDRFISHDYGTDHPNVYLEWWDDGDTLWLDRECIWDSRKEMRQKTDSQLVDDLFEFMGPNNGCQVITPPEALSFKNECLQRGVWTTNANNEVSTGIKAVGNMLAKGKIRINRKCERVLRGISTHAWDPNKAKRGIEEPMKQDDDEADAFRYGVFTKVPGYRWSAAE